MTRRYMGPGWRTRSKLPGGREAVRVHLWHPNATRDTDGPRCGARVPRYQTRAADQPMNADRCCTECLIQGLRGAHEPA
jgi:hypothetical protein